MKVFISWSGDRSHEVAKLLHEWLVEVIQALEPWISSSDIERGSQWNNRLNTELESTSQGIFCLTAENKDAPWILFEAGSLAKGQATSRVYTLLIDVPGAEVTGPLIQFNHTVPTKEGMRTLIGNLNNKLGDRQLAERRLEKAFESNWPDFEERFKKILNETPSTTPKESRGDKEILSEILELVRNYDNRITKLEKSERSTQIITSSDWKRHELAWLGSLKYQTYKSYVGFLRQNSSLSEIDIIEMVRKQFPDVDIDDIVSYLRNY